MVLLAGVTGSGKSTTIASMLNLINHHYRKHILTLEDPIEFVFTEDKCLINQREIGLDVIDFEIGMKHAVREDPDVMLVGEMRDQGNVHDGHPRRRDGPPGVRHDPRLAAPPPTIGRILDLFPQDMHSALRSAIAFNMKGIVAQKLLKSIKPGVGRVPTVEIMIFNTNVQKADSGRERRQAARRHPHRQARRHAGFHDEPQAAGRRRADRPRSGDGSGAQPRSAQDGAQGHRSEGSWDYLMRQRLAIWFLLPCLWLAWPIAAVGLAQEPAAAGCRTASAAGAAAGRSRTGAEQPAPVRPPARRRAAPPADAAAEPRRRRAQKLDKWNDAHSIPRLKQSVRFPGPSCSCIWLLVPDLGEVGRLGQSRLADLRPGYGKWNPILFFPFFAVLLLFAFPILVGFANFLGGVRPAVRCATWRRSCRTW